MSPILGEPGSLLSMMAEDDGPPRRRVKLRTRCGCERHEYVSLSLPSRIFVLLEEPGKTWRTVDLEPKGMMPVRTFKQQAPHSPTLYVEEP